MAGCRVSIYTSDWLFSSYYVCSWMLSSLMLLLYHGEISVNKKKKHLLQIQNVFM